MRRLVLATSALVVLTLGAPARAQTEDPVVAIVNGTQIKRSDLEAARQQLPEQYREMPIEQLYEPLLDRMIDSQLLLAEAQKQKLGDTPAVQAEIARARDNVLRDSLVQQAIDKDVTPEKLQAAYNALKSQPGFASEEVHAHHILVADEATARDILQQLKGGADFATLAKEKSIDPSAQTNGGNLGYFKRDAMVPEFAEAAFTIPPDTVGTEPVKTQFGWHVIKIEDRRQTVPSFEEKEPELREQAEREAVNALVAEVREGAKIERFNADGTPKAE
jgi:peptidyl-prolyl cis-trans isomerase C